MLEPSAGVAPLRLSSKPDSMLIFGRDIDPQAKTAIGVRSIQISRKQGQLRRLADGTVECTQVGTGLMRCNGGYFQCGEVRQLTVGDVLELLEINACPDGKGKVRKVVASWSVVEPPDHRDRPPPHSAPMAKRVRLGPLPPAADAQLWVALKDAALNDLIKSKTELANTQAIMQRQNSIILAQTSTIAAFKDMMKSSRGALALSSLAELVHTVTPEVFATIVRVVATRLGT
jgi:hypothetical protein